MVYQIAIGIRITSYLNLNLKYHKWWFWNFNCESIYLVHILNKYLQEHFQFAIFNIYVVTKILEKHFSKTTTLRTPRKWNIYIATRLNFPAVKKYFVANDFILRYISWCSFRAVSFFQWYKNRPCFWHAGIVNFTIRW